MSLINQMLQDLDAQQGNAKQPAVAELVATSRKGRTMGLPGMLGLLLAAALGAGISWVLGQADGAATGEMIPLTLPELAARPQQTEPPRPAAVVLRAPMDEQPKRPSPVPVAAGTKVPEPLAMYVEALPQSPAVGQITAAVPALGPAQTELEQRSSRQQAEMPSALAILAPSQPTAPDAAQTSSIEQPKKPPSVKVAARTTFNAGKQTSASAYLRDARLYLRQGRLADAEQALKRTLHKDPEVHQAREMLAALLLRGGRKSETAALLDQGLRLVPGQPVFVGLRARLYRERGEADQAITLLQQGLRNEPDNSDLLELLAVLYQERERFDEAAVVYRRILKRQPDSAKSWAGLGISLEAASEIEGALQAYHRALSNDGLPREVVDYVRQRVSALGSR